MSGPIFDPRIPEQALTELMNLAIAEARQAAQEAEVPIGAVICSLSSLRASSPPVVLGKGHNRVEQTRNATAHAEMLAIREATQSIGNWRLSDSVLVSTLEPCVMCLGAIRLSRIPVVVFGGGDSRFGALGSVYNICESDRSGPAPFVYRGVRAEECVQMLKSFFEARRD